MSVEFYVCKNCGSTFPDCGEYISCEQCFTHWCSDECAEEDGYNKEHCAAHEELDDGDLMDMYRENTVITSVAAIVIIMFQIVANIVEKKILRTMFYWREFLTELYRVTKSTIIIFCGKEQLSEIHKFFSDKQKKGKGTVRQLIWQKSNPSPMNGQHIYLSGIENAVWFKKRGGTFNAHCKNTVFTYPCGRSKLHPTEKNHDLLKELILDNSVEGDVMFDPCSGSGSHLLVASENDRKWIGTELNEEYFNIARERLGGV